MSKLAAASRNQFIGVSNKGPDARSSEQRLRSRSSTTQHAPVKRRSVSAIGVLEPVRERSDFGTTAIVSVCWTSQPNNSD